MGKISSNGIIMNILPYRYPQQNAGQRNVVKSLLTVKRQITEDICAVKQDHTNCLFGVVLDGLCDQHRFELILRGYFPRHFLALFQLKIKLIYKIIKNNGDIMCRISEKGGYCHRLAKDRGLCGTHGQKFRRWNMLDYFSLPSKIPSIDSSNLAVTENPIEGKCILVITGVDCNRNAIRRGICSKHDTYLRSKNRFEEFALRPLRVRNPKK